MKIVTISNRVAAGFSPARPDEWGGGEEVFVRTAQALAQLGHDVEGYVPEAPSDHGDAVAWRPHDALPTRIEGDLVLLHKWPEIVARCRARRMVLWTDEPRRFLADAFGLVVVPSRFVGRMLSAMLPALAGRLEVLPQGIDPRLAAVGTRREPNLVLWGSSPDRGLDQLLAIWPRVLEVHPTARLVITQGWARFDACRGDPTCKARIQDAIKRHHQSVEMRRLTRAEMDGALQRAGVWAYYCTGGEYYCRLAIEAQMAGVVPVVRPWGGLHETVLGGLRAASLEEFGAALIEALNPDRQAELRRAIPGGPDFRHHERWAELTRDWQTYARRLLELAEPERERTRTTRLMVVPATPELEPELESRAFARISARVQSWLASVKSAHPWISPTLGVGALLALSSQDFELVSDPASADAALLGWELEDGELAPEGQLQQLGLKRGEPLAVVASIGPWRAARRRRELTRGDLSALFRRQPECQMRAESLGAGPNGFWFSSFKYDPGALGSRVAPSLVTAASVRETLCAAIIVRDSEGTIESALTSVLPIADQVVCLDTGSQTQECRDRVRRLARKRGGYFVEVDSDGFDPAGFRRQLAAHAGPGFVWARGHSPYWCFDCLREHAVGEFLPGHRLAGFETPRNQSIQYAVTDWILWLDSDEELLQAQELAKYLRANVFAGYAIGQHHFSCEPQNIKVDLPLRLFRRREEGRPGWTEVNGWPTYHPGLSARFAGIVHEHPGCPPEYTGGMTPVVVLSDVWIAHSGYYTERARRGRFRRNWPLMVADREKYPERRLGRFLWLRDLNHQLRYELERTRGQGLSPEGVAVAEECLRLWREDFAGRVDPYTAEALMYATTAAQVLGRGVDMRAVVEFRKPEVSGDETIKIELSGRVENPKDVLRQIEARLSELERWEPPYV